MPENSKRRRQTVLIVEDELILRDMLARVLTLRGHRVVAVATVAEGLAELDGQDCVILDLNLPDGLGTRVLERIRAEKRPIRVAVTTGSTDDAVLADVRLLKPELLLLKPIDVKVLLAWVAGPD